MGLATASPPIARTEAASTARRMRRSPSYQTGESGWSALKQALDQELPVPRKPVSEMPSIPDDITELPDSALMTLFRKLMAWQKYLGTQLALAEVDEKSSTRKLARYEKRYDFRKAADKERAANDPDYDLVSESTQEAYAYRRLVEALYATVEGDTFLCSRELSRRLGTADRDHRNARFNA